MNKLHYKGDCRDFVPNRIIGPDTGGAWWMPVSAHYFDGITTIYYRPVPPNKLPPQAAWLSRQVVAQRNRGKVDQWPRGNGPSLGEKSASSSLAYQISRRSGGRKKPEVSAAFAPTKSQRKLLKRLRTRG